MQMRLSTDAMPPGVEIRVDYDHHEVSYMGSRNTHYIRGKAHVTVTYMGQEIHDAVRYSQRDLWSENFTQAYKMWLLSQLQLWYGT